MGLVIDSTCRNCGVAIEPLSADESGIVTDWIHAGLSVWCPGGTGPVQGYRYRATPTVKAVPSLVHFLPDPRCTEYACGADAVGRRQSYETDPTLTTCRKCMDTQAHAMAIDPGENQ
jgi:hypothetical protein